MSFREKSAWISLLSTLIIYGLYFRSVFHAGLRSASFDFGGLLGTIVALVVVQVILTIAVAILTPKEAATPPDEREKLIDLKASRFAYAALSFSVACACFFGGFNPPLIFSVNSLLFILVMAEILRSGCQIIQYRRGA
jgi:hypothetical protein